MLLKVTASVTVPPLPVKDRLFTVLATVKVVAERLPVKLAVPPMLCKIKLPEPLTLVPLMSAAEVPVPVPVCNVKL